MYRINEFIERPESPVCHGELQKERKRRIDERKVHRVRNPLASVAYVLNVVSPSEIYIRWSDVTTPRLTRKFPTKLEKIEVYEPPEPLAYVMAPWKENILGRARIIQVLKNDDVYLIFIDEGQYAIVSKNDLYHMPEKLRTHPWQATKVVLYGAIPYNRASWQPQEVTALRSVIAKYPALWVMPLHTMADDIDDSFNQRVLLHGLQHDTLDRIKSSNYNQFDTYGEDVLTLYNCVLMEYNMVNLSTERILDARFQPEYPFYVEEFSNEVPRKACGAIDPASVIPVEPAQRWFEVNPFPQMKKYTLAQLVDKGHARFHDANYQIMGLCHTIFHDIQCPNRFFVYRMKFINEKEFPRILHFDDSQRRLKAKMTSYYFSGNNLHPMDFAKVHAALKEDIRVFAVFEKHSYTPVYNHTYERIEILKCYVAHASQPGFFVRFLDSGGCQKVPLRRVFHIHAQHLEGIPLALLLCMPERFPVEGKKWTNEDLYNFRKELGTSATLIANMMNPYNVDITRPIPVSSTTITALENNATYCPDFSKVGHKPPIVKTNAYFDLDLDDYDRYVDRYLFSSSYNERDSDFDESAAGDETADWDAAGDATQEQNAVGDETLEELDQAVEELNMDAMEEPKNFADEPTEVNDENAVPL
uniref:Tudor domain-containing protein n=1 Tax=Panagrellus redivivus TaxID=6233 RepID=A0A7E4ZZ32_PANRE